MIREYKIEDNLIIFNMLLNENIPVQEYRYNEYPTWVLDEDGVKGFFTVKTAWGFPAIQHFCVGKEYRSMGNARKLIKAVKDIVCELGFKKMLLHSDKPYLHKMIEYYFKTKSYKEIDKRKFYLVEV